jgi:hypothetical protein
MGVKASYGMELKSAQAWGCPKSHAHKMSIQRHNISSHHFPPPLPLSLFLFVVLELADRYKSAQPIGLFGVDRTE